MPIAGTVMPGCSVLAALIATLLLPLNVPGRDACRHRGLSHGDRECSFIKASRPSRRRSLHGRKPSLQPPCAPTDMPAQIARPYVSRRDADLETVIAHRRFTRQLASCHPRTGTRTKTGASVVAIERQLA